ncbi:helix-turn-helix transcriptional regulator [Bradyrhizobium manausense]|uniref:helix-turn-helix transcriptional regulator n=1 Tax=Bradyrhizobium manausense TaxID=989370 RepID=UPI001BA96933|nr:helix-turn-helix transcriptional regulator [Bradyrhizobium manausense]MBR1092697.1 helix-turn-helix transcriptional regulator [Bradyrhizobium manausense]
MSRFPRKEHSRLVNPPPPNSIRFFRIRAGLARADLGRKLGVAGETIRKLEQCDTWLDADRAVEIGRILGVPYELLGFSYASDAYAWATKAVPVVGEITANDQVKFARTDRIVAGSAHLPQGCVALEIKIGKMRGWNLIYQEAAQLSMSSELLAQQGNRENFLVHLVNGTTWWRHVLRAQTIGLHHLQSQYVDVITDARIAWVSEVLGFELARYPLPTPAQLKEKNEPPSDKSAAVAR